MEKSGEIKRRVVINEPMKHVTNELKIPAARIYLLNALCMPGELGTLSAKYFKDLESLLERFGADCVAAAINNLNQGNKFSVGPYTILPAKKRKPPKP